MLTVIDELFDPVLHNKLDPLVDNVEVPQLFTTVTTGAAGMALGDAFLFSGELVQPFTVWVTV